MPIPPNQYQHIPLFQQRPILKQVIIPIRDTEPPMDYLRSPSSTNVSESMSPQEPFVSHNYVQLPRPGGVNCGDVQYSLLPTVQSVRNTVDNIEECADNLSSQTPEQHNPLLSFPESSIPKSGWPTPQPPPPRIRLSPLPMQRVSKTRPITRIACLFCRGRKIGCGWPGTTEKPCQ